MAGIFQVDMPEVSVTDSRLPRIRQMTASDVKVDRLTTALLDKPAVAPSAV